MTAESAGCEALRASRPVDETSAAIVAGREASGNNGLLRGGGLFTVPWSSKVI